METLRTELAEPKTIDDIRRIYDQSRPVMHVAEDVAKACEAVLIEEGYEPISRSLDVALHDEDAYPSIGVAAHHHDSCDRYLRNGAVLGPAIFRLSLSEQLVADLRTMGVSVTEEPDQAVVFYPRGVGFWVKPKLIED